MPPLPPDFTTVFVTFTVDEDGYTASVGDKDLDLTYTEFELLVTLASSPGRVFSRSALLRRVWGDEFRDERTVDVHIRHLREKIERDPRNPEFIHTARGVGYVFR